MQHARAPTAGRSAQAVVDEIAARNAGAEPLGSLGVVVGATIGDTGVDCRRLNGPILAPGVGAQGGTADDVRRIVRRRRRRVLPSVSREVLRAGPDANALRDAARRYRDEFAFLTA